MKKIAILCLYLVISGINLVSAQQVISSGGDYFSNSVGSISQTIGETVIDTYSTSSNILTQGFQQPLGATISGQISYNNSPNTPLTSVKIFLIRNGDLIDSALVNSQGQYQFLYKPQGEYTFSCTTTLPWGGVNALDAAKVARHAAGLEMLTIPIRLTAADVNNSNSINALDVTKIKRRVAGMAAAQWIRSRNIPKQVYRRAFNP